MQASSAAAARLAALAAVLVLGACSSGSAVTTNSLLGGGETKAAAPATTPATITDRVVHVGTTAARAQRCGFVFDAAMLRQDYLAYEARLGGTPEQLAKAEKSYDYTLASITKAISGNADYCSEEQTAIIKRDLTKALTGDFSLPAKQASKGWWFENPTREKPMDRDAIFDPIRR
jgi:hypothetical protein